MGRNMRTLYLLLVSACACFGQPFTFLDPAFVCHTNVATGEWVDTYYPTNIAGIYTWYVADGNYSVVGANAWLTNLTVNSGLELTNVESGKSPTYNAAALNGRGVLVFDGANDYLKSVNYTSSQPHEVWLVIKQVIASDANHFFFDSVTSSARNTLISISDKTYDIFAGSDSYSAVNSVITNKWYVLSGLFNGNLNASKIYTNNVLMVNSSAGTQAIGGFTLGSRYSLTFPANISLAELITFRTNLDHAATGVASNLFNYITNKYAISL
jgi:hypothetical protein